MNTVLTIQAIQFMFEEMGLGTEDDRGRFDALRKLAQLTRSNSDPVFIQISTADTSEQDDPDGKLERNP